MKSLHVVVYIILFVLLLVGGGVLIYGASDEQAWILIVQFMFGQRVLMLAAGVVFEALLVAFLLTGVRESAPEEYLSFDNEGGRVSISIAAIRDFLGRLHHEFAAIDKITTDLRPCKGSIEIIMDVKVKSGAQIPELCRMLQDRVRETIHNSLGISDIRGVQVNVREIVQTPVANQPSSIEEATAG